MQNYLLNIKGHVEYDESLAVQKYLVGQRKQGEVGDVALILEHEPIITLGKDAGPGLLKASPDEINSRGIKIRQIERGGKVTYHGPGQVVLYSIREISTDELSDHVDALEEVMIVSSKEMGAQLFKRTDINHETGKRYVGVWHNDGGITYKVGAVGVQAIASMNKHVTMHGFALNVSSCLEGFSLIYPCGLKNVKAASISSIIKKPLDMDYSRSVIARNYKNIFGHNTKFIEFDYERDHLINKIKELISKDNNKNMDLS